MVRYEDHASLAFVALADPTRRQILDRLVVGPATVSELAERHDLSVPGVLKHLRVLERGDLVKSEKGGRTRVCQLNPMPIAALTAYLERYRARWERKLDALQRLIDEVGSGSDEARG